MLSVPGLKFCLTAVLIVLLASCGQHHSILGANDWGWEAAKVTVLSNIEVNSLRVRHVRVGDQVCKGGFREHLELSGPIGPDSSEVVERVLQKMSKCEFAGGTGSYSPHVYLHSPGGLLRHGSKLGQTLRTFHANAVITKGQLCASSCAIAFIGAPYRSIEYDGQLLFHSPYNSSGRGIACIDREQAQEMRMYMVNFLGSKDGEFAFDRTMSFCSQNSGWLLNADAAKLFGIATSR